MGRRGDAISVVEASYQLGGTDEQWLMGVAKAVDELPFPEPVGTLAYHIKPLGGGFRIETPVQAGSQYDLVGRIARMGRLLDRCREGSTGLAERACALVYERVIRAATELRPDQLLIDEYRRFGPRWMYTLGVPKTRDVMLLVNQHIDGLGTTIIARGTSRRGSLSPAQRRMYQMLGAHIKAGYRLRHRLTPALSLPGARPCGAVIDARTMRVVNASGDAQEAPARDAIRQAAVAVDQLRASKGERGEQALDVWQGLIDGRWSLIDHVETDGKRLILAHRNPERVRDPRGLTDMEARVARLAARGYANKLIGYHLGISEGTVAAHLHRCCRKLRASGRTQLVKMLNHAQP